MKKLFSTKYSAAAFNAATFILRITLGMLLITHGYDKLKHISDNHDQFINFLGLGRNLSFYLVVFAEFFCSLLVMLGLFTRLAAFAIVIDMGVALAIAHKWDAFDTGERAALFLGGFIVVLLLGPGRASIDSMISK
jgi:putative oxidoreductase